MVYRINQVVYKQYLSNQLIIRTSIEYNLHNNYQRLLEDFSISNPLDTLRENEKRYCDPKTIQEAEITTLIHSAVCCSNDKASYIYFLFEAYKKFPEASLSAAISQLKRSSVITVNKNKDKAILPYSFSLFHLSVRYGTQIISVHVPVELYDEYWQVLKDVSTCNGSHQITTINCGWIHMLSELLSTNKNRLSYDEADKLVMIDPQLRKKSKFEQISDNYMRLMNKDAQEGQQKKVVKFTNEEIVDETFLYNEDPIEIFFKVNQVFLHAFCILRALEDGEDIQVKNCKIAEDGECGLRNCIIQDDANFAERIRKIACESQDLIREIIGNAFNCNGDKKRVTKENFLQIFDDILQKQLLDSEENNRKDISGKVPSSRSKMSADSFLEVILSFSTELELEGDSWLLDYKKITQRADEDVFIDDELETAGENFKNLKRLTQLKDLNISTRTCDSYVVNLATIYVDINEGLVEKDQIDGVDFDKLLLPFSQEDRTKVIEKIINDIKWRPENLEVKDLFDVLNEANVTNTLEIMQMSEICSVLQSTGQMGATSDELLNLFTDKLRMQKQMEVLLRIKFVLRVGVNEMRFVHREYARFWLIDTFYTKREANDAPVSSTDSEDGNKRKCAEKPDEVSAKKAKLDYDAPCTSSSLIQTTITSQEKADDCVVFTEEDSIQPKKAPLLRIPIYINPNPWIRVNGTLNRRVLDKWLGTILNHLTLNPSMMLNDLCNKFNILKPFDVRCLCETLENIGCVKLVTITEPEIDLFSSNVDARVEPATLFCSFDRIFIELEDDAMQRLTFFIGRKKYKTPFV